MRCSASYYINSSGLCNSCASIFPNCTKCTASECYQCEPSLNLLNSTKCGIANATILPIYTNYPCLDPRCDYCSQSALHICLVCIDRNLTIINGMCVADCGDGLMYDT